MSRVLITGACGFAGTALCRELRNRGHLLSGTTRDPARKQGGDGTPLYVIPDMDGATDWSRAVRGAEVVIHLAARTHMTGEPGAEALDIYRQTNVEGSRALTEAAAAAGVRQFVFLSSIKAVGERSGGKGLTEQTEPAPEDAYGLSKLEAEKAIRAAAGGRMSLTILRPPLIYGPGVRANFLKLLAACEARRPLPLAGIQNQRSLVFVGNLAHAIAECIDRPEAAKGVFHIADSEPVSTPGLIRAIGRALGRRQRLFPAPKAVLRIAGSITARRSAVDRLLGSLVVDGSRFRSALRWTPPYDFKAGLAETADWYRRRDATS